MGRGPEEAEQAILEHTETGGIWPVMFLARASGHDINDLSIRQSFGAAARQLHMKGLVELWWITAPPAASITLDSLSNSGDVMCVSRPGVELTTQVLWQVRDRIEAVFNPSFDNFDLDVLERSFQEMAYRLDKPIESR